MGGTQWANHDLECKINKLIASLDIKKNTDLKRLPTRAEAIVCVLTERLTDMLKMLYKYRLYRICMFFVSSGGVASGTCASGFGVCCLCEWKCLLLTHVLWHKINTVTCWIKKNIVLNTLATFPITNRVCLVPSNRFLLWPSKLWKTVLNKKNFLEKTISLENISYTVQTIFLSNLNT
jgi:hypothetical protein